MGFTEIGVAVAVGIGFQVLISWRGRQADGGSSSALKHKLSDDDVTGGGGAPAFHTRRAVQHLLSGVLLLAIHAFVLTEKSAALAALMVALAFGLSVQVARKRHPPTQQAFMAVFGPILRKDEEQKLPGAFWFLLGIVVSLGLFSRPAALLSVILLSVCDPAAAAAGTAFGGSNRWLPHGKSAAGFLGAWAVGSIATQLSLAFVLDARRICTAADQLTFVVASGFFGAFGEAIYLGVDDNLSLPVVAGAMLELLMRGMLLWQGENADGGECWCGDFQSALFADGVRSCGGG